MEQRNGNSGNRTGLTVALVILLIVVLIACALLGLQACRKILGVTTIGNRPEYPVIPDVTALPTKAPTPAPTAVVTEAPTPGTVPYKADPETLLGRWEDIDDPLNLLTFTEEGDGRYAVSVWFYRIVSFDAAFSGETDEEGRLVFRDDTGEFVCHVGLEEDVVFLTVDTPNEYGGIFDGGMVHVYVRSPEKMDTGWIGTWTSDDGEILEIYEEREDCILLVYSGWTASGEDMFDSEYTLYFDSDDRRSAAEDDSVLALAGWRYRLILDGEKIVMESRYPDRIFWKAYALDGDD